MVSRDRETNESTRPLILLIFILLNSLEIQNLPLRLLDLFRAFLVIRDVKFDAVYDEQQKDRVHIITVLI